MNGPSTRRAARKAEGGRRRLATEWVVIPLIIVLVFVVVFGSRFLSGLSVSGVAEERRAFLPSVREWLSDARTPEDDTINLHDDEPESDDL